MTVGRAGAPDGCRWIADQSCLEDLLDELAGVDAYGLDTEFHRERSYFAKLALVQVRWPRGVALIDPLAVDVAPLARVLEGPGTCVMHAGAQDLEILLRLCGALPRSLFDTQVASGFLGYASPSLANLVRGELGARLPKADRLTDWLSRPLPPGAAQYAAADVAHLLALHDRLRAQLLRRGRLAWARAECDLARARQAAGPDPARAWWRVKEARALRGRAAAVAQELGAWRERKAMELDKPVRTVLADLALVAMAQRPPEREEDLARVRGLEDRHRRGRAAELLAAVRRGIELELDEVHLPPAEGVDPSKRAAAAIVAAWVAQQARDLEIDPAIMATRADVEAVLDAGGGRLAKGWRAEVVGEPIRLLAAGRASVAIDAQGRLVLERRSGAPVGDARAVSLAEEPEPGRVGPRARPTG